MNSKVYIRLKDKKYGFESQEVTIEDIIFNQSEIEFIFNSDLEGILEKTTIPYKDFLFYQNDYDVIVRIKAEEP